MSEFGSRTDRVPAFPGRAARPGHEWPSQRGQQPLSGEILRPRTALSKADPTKVGFDEFASGLGLLNRAFAMRISGKETRAQLREAVSAIVATRMKTEIYRSNLLGSEARQTLLVEHEQRMTAVTRAVGRIANEATADLSEDYYEALSETAQWSKRMTDEIQRKLDHGLISAEMAEIMRGDLEHTVALRTQVGREFLEAAAQHGIGKIQAALSRGDFDIPQSLQERY